MSRESSVRLLVTPDSSAADVMIAIVTRTGLAVSELGVVAAGVKVDRCAVCVQDHPGQLRLRRDSADGPRRDYRREPLTAPPPTARSTHRGGRPMHPDYLTFHAAAVVA